MTTEHTLVERAPVRLLALRHVGPYGEPVGRFWRETVQPWVAANGWGGRSQYGIGRDDPSQTPPEACRYDVGVDLGDLGPSPQALAPAAGTAFELTLAGGLHLVVPFHGTPSSIGAAWGDVMGRLMPALGWTFAGSPFEHYAADSPFDPATGAFGCELCVPVRRA